MATWIHHRSFSAKEPCNYWLFCEKILQLKVSYETHRIPYRRGDVDSFPFILIHIYCTYTHILYIHIHLYCTYICTYTVHTYTHILYIHIHIYCTYIYTYTVHTYTRILYILYMYTSILYIFAEDDSHNIHSTNTTYNPSNSLPPNKYPHRKYLRTAFLRTA